MLPGLISLLIFLVLFVFFFRLMLFVIKIFLVIFVIIFIFAAVNPDKFECTKLNDETHCHFIDKSDVATTPLKTNKKLDKPASSVNPTHADNQEKIAPTKPASNTQE